MYVVQVEVRTSPIDGKGVFVLENVPKGTIVWKFDPLHDQTMSKEAFTAADQMLKEELLRIAYLSKNTDRWIFPPENDPARYTNHSTKNNLSVLFDESISDEPLFIANRDIQSGEELTNNYTEFDEYVSEVPEDWLT